MQSKPFVGTTLRCVLGFVLAYAGCRAMALVWPVIDWWITPNAWEWESQIEPLVSGFIGGIALALVVVPLAVFLTRSLAGRAAVLACIAFGALSAIVLAWGVGMPLLDRPVPWLQALSPEGWASGADWFGDKMPAAISMLGLGLVAMYRSRKGTPISATSATAPTAAPSAGS